MTEHLKSLSTEQGDLFNAKQKREVLVIPALKVLNKEATMTEPQNEAQASRAPQPNINKLSSFEDKLKAMGILDKEGNQLPPSEKEGTGEDLNPEQLGLSLAERMALYTNNTATPGQLKHKETMEIEMDERLAKMSPEERERVLAKMKEDKRRVEENAAKVSETNRWRKYTLYPLPSQLKEMPDFPFAELYNQYNDLEMKKKHEEALATLIVISRELYRLYRAQPRTFVHLYLKVATLTRDFADHYGFPLSTEKLKAM